MSKKILSIVTLLLILLCSVAIAEQEDSEWMSLKEAQSMFCETLGKEVILDVTCRTSFWVDGSTNAWLQIEVMYDGTTAVTGIWSSDIMMSLDILQAMQENGAKWDNGAFVIDPQVFPYLSLRELVLEPEWGTIYLKKARVESFLDFCIGED